MEKVPAGKALCTTHPLLADCAFVVELLQLVFSSIRECLSKVTRSPAVVKVGVDSMFEIGGECFDVQKQ